MKLSEYQSLAARTINKQLNTEQMIQNAALGLCGESGEVADHIKKVFFQGHPLDGPDLMNELGDVLWYIAEMCTALGISMDIIAEYNIEKLKKRYPEGFSTELSINRKE